MRKGLRNLLVQSWITTSDIPNVALEVLDVDGIEADDGLH
jgi:hypothetical protein